jgi:hypothetical protein
MSSNWQPFELVKKRRFVGREGLPENAVRISTARQNKGISLTLRVGTDVARELRWLVGDKVMPVRSPDGMLGFVRSPDGWKLTPARQSDQRKKNLEGKTVPMVCKMCIPEDIRSLYVNGSPRVIAEPLVDGST